jgi:hypothetical protein
MSKRPDKRQMAYTAAGMYGGAAFLSVVEGAIPGGPALSLIPGLAAMVLVALIAAVGPRLPLPVLGTVGAIGAALIAYAIATTPPGQGDGVLLYIWPVLWVAYFFGRRASVLIVAWIGVVQGAALVHLHGVLDRWIDLVVSVGIVAVVVQVLSERNARLVTRLAEEARVDKLTGVLNRRGFEERGAVEVERGSRVVRTSTTSRASTTSGATTPAIACSSAWARSSAPNRGRWTSSGGWGARSSSRCCRPPTPSRRWPTRSASGPPSRPRSSARCRT